MHVIEQSGTRNFFKTKLDLVLCLYIMFIIFVLLLSRFILHQMEHLKIKNIMNITVYSGELSGCKVVCFTEPKKKKSH